MKRGKDFHDAFGIRKRGRRKHCPEDRRLAGGAPAPGVIVKVKESRVAISREMAQKIMV